MSFNIELVLAQTHTPEYLMHKYWARKPHNVISECIKKLTNEDEIVIDPFCGSGVVIREAALLGRNCIGFDLNPTAVLISSVLVNPPKKNEFIETFNNIYNKVYKKYGYLYKSVEGKNIKYISHRIISKCTCGKLLKLDECIREGKKCICPECNKIVRFNLESLIDTEIFDIAIEGQKEFQVSEEDINAQKEKSSYIDNTLKYVYNYEFPENRRILSFKGIKTESFFTKRNFTILTAFANEIWSISDMKVRNCCLELLTASIAQCSRLIAHRNNLSTGGPAWSVPGFWIPQEHLETNPFVHIQARLKKIIKAIETLDNNPIKGNTKIIEGDSLELLQSSEFNNLKANLIFLDPPYGDSVPYTEFSNIWNSFLKKIPCSDDDISVSDRIDKKESWKIYSEKLHKYMACFKNILEKNGKLLITFNNNDMKAWKALISSLQDNKFICKSVFYQIPAVISSKAQMSLDTSYISDVYSVYEYSENLLPSRDLTTVISHLCYVANCRNGRISKIVLDREFIISWLQNNVDNKLLENKEQIIDTLFVYDKNSKTYVLKEEFKKDTPIINDIIINEVDEILKTGPIQIIECYKRVCSKFHNYGIPELSEFKQIISQYAIKDNVIYGNTIC